ncbi:MAG TPA: hypothetical protein VFA46_17560 [Actinomycetes bacterium]|jgi:oligoendopeptidase F|nr:hypothetical protein [Actinomycetes bacterium]
MTAARGSDVAELVAAADAELVAELAATAAQVDTEVTALTATLTRFAALEIRLQHTAERVEERTGRQIDDEEWSRLADRLGVSSIRPLLERLAQAHPDVLATGG